MSERVRHNSLTTRSVFVLACAFALVATLALGGDGCSCDQSLLRAVHAHETHELEQVARAATWLGRVTQLAALVAILAGILAMRGAVAPAAYVAITTAVAWIGNIALKQVFRRPRPQLWQSIAPEHHTFAFPSGHAMTSAALATAVVVVTWHTRWRYPVLLAATACAFTVGWSRIYLGVHWPTDVLAGWIAGCAVALALLPLDRARRL